MDSRVEQVFGGLGTESAQWTDPDCHLEWEGEMVLACRGELDLLSSRDLVAALDEATPVAGPTVVVDLRAVTFVECVALSELVRARNHRRAHGGDLTVRTPSPFVLRVIEMAGLTELIGEERLIDEERPPVPVPQTGTTRISESDLEGLIRAWSSECSTAAFGAAPLVFTHPRDILAGIGRPLDPQGAPMASVRSAHLRRAEDSSPSVAVLQLLALGHVLRSWLAQRVDPSLDHGRGGGPRSVVDRTIATAVTEIVAEVEDIALIDSLTGLLNRRALDRDLLKLLAVARRHRQSLSVVMVDIDGLKETNDQHGHDVGDQSLRDLATSLVSAIRAGDDAYRIGGDEFVLLLPGLHRADVSEMMLRTLAGDRNGFTWGAACAEYDSDDPVEDLSDRERAARLLRLADERMLDHRDLSGHVDRTSPSVAHMDATLTDAELAGRIRASNAETVVVEQAIGLIAEHVGTSIRSARELLESAAHRRRTSAPAVAFDLVERHVELDELFGMPPRERSLVAVERRADADTDAGTDQHGEPT